MTNKTDLLVIGAGPSGYACAFHAADLGRDVTMVDMRDTLGGVCLNEACIPSKTLLHAAETIGEAAHMADWGIIFGKPKINLDALRVWKGGIIGLEMATIYSAFGSKVILVELADQIALGADPQAVSILHAALVAQGITIHTVTQVELVTASKNNLTLSCIGDFDGKIKADATIQSVGRRANRDSVNAQAAGLEVSDRGIIEADSAGRTAIPHIFAIGGVTGNPMLAHRATHQDHVAAEVVAGHRAELSTALIRSVAYINPELAWVGQPEVQAAVNGQKVKSTNFPWPRAVATLRQVEATG